MANTEVSENSAFALAGFKIRHAGRLLFTPPTARRRRVQRTDKKYIKCATDLFPNVIQSPEVDFLNPSHNAFLIYPPAIIGMRELRIVSMIVTIPPLDFPQITEINFFITSLTSAPDKIPVTVTLFDLPPTCYRHSNCIFRF
jgi:hypothetical protein